ncbi:MAG: hypothetical protein KAU44_06200 [Candidatus Marinimicrobia bacterium]|nr:hypothetical protein [Candidatus Neomarinimicrobiota bacterium]
MTTIKRILIFLGIILIMFSCQIWEQDDMDFTYPLETGRTWTYQREWILTNFDSDSLERIFGHSESYEITSSVTGPQTLNDSIDVIGLTAGNRISYYKEEDDGLYLIGYGMNGGELVLPKSTQKGGIIINGVHFNSIEQLFDILQHPLSLMKPTTDSIYIEENPKRALEYPLKDADTWCYREDHKPFRINKKIIGTDIVSVDTSTFNCYHIKWNYDIDADGITDDNIYIDDYISEEGLIKRTISVLNMINQNAFGDTLGSYDSYDYYTLKNYTK